MLVAARTLERLVEKVGRIDRRAGDGLDALLTRLVRLKSESA